MCSHFYHQKTKKEDKKAAMSSRPEIPDGQENLLRNGSRQQLDQDHDGPPEPSHPPLLWQMFWWLLTLSLSAFILVTIKIYQNEGNIMSVPKYMFNTISTTLILGLGLNFFVSYHPHAINGMCRG